MADIHDLRIGQKVVYNNTQCTVYGLSMPMPSQHAYYDNVQLVTLCCNGLITVRAEEVEDFVEN